MVKIRMSEMTRVDIQKALDRGFGTVVFAVGSNEQAWASSAYLYGYVGR
jgi:hypothetical protein